MSRLWEVADVIAVSWLACGVILDTMFCVLPLFPVLQMRRITALNACLKNLGYESVVDTSHASSTCGLYPCAAGKQNCGAKGVLRVRSPRKAPLVQPVTVPGMAESPEQGRGFLSESPLVSPMLGVMPTDNGQLPTGRGGF